MSEKLNAVGDNIPYYENRLGPERLTEISLSRILRKLPEGTPFTLITGYRLEKIIDGKRVNVTSGENSAAQERLHNTFRSMGFAATRTIGAFRMDDPKRPGEKDLVKEPILFVVGIFREQTLKRARKFGQESILWGEYGKSINVIHADGRTEYLGRRITVNTLSAACDRIKDKRLTFESLSYVPHGLMDAISWECEMRREVSSSSQNGN